MASLVNRKGNFYIQYSVGTRMKRESLRTKSKQIAEEMLRQFKSAEYQGLESPLPTKTHISEVVGAYVRKMRATKTERSVKADIQYLRAIFGECCEELEYSQYRNGARYDKKPVKVGRQAVRVIEKSCFEAINTQDIADFITGMVDAKGLEPTTANRYREVLHTLFSWAISEGRVKMPNDKNPVTAFKKFRVHAPQIRYLNLEQIEEQLEAMEAHRLVQTVVAMYIYAGIRREEASWLTFDDVDLHAGTNGMIRIRAKTIDGNMWQPKTKKNRVIPISRSLLPYLMRYKPAETDQDWYFPSPRSHNQWDPDNLSRAIRVANKPSGLKWTCLDYRHTFGSQLAQKGVSLYKISALMGNSPEICRRHYAALVPEAMVDEVEFGSVCTGSQLIG